MAALIGRAAPAALGPYWIERARRRFGLGADGTSLRGALRFANRVLRTPTFAHHVAGALVAAAIVEPRSDLDQQLSFYVDPRYRGALERTCVAWARDAKSARSVGTDPDAAAALEDAGFTVLDAIQWWTGDLR